MNVYVFDSKNGVLCIVNRRSYTQIYFVIKSIKSQVSIQFNNKAVRLSFVSFIVAFVGFCTQQDNRTLMNDIGS